LAADYARRDASITHTGNGIYGEQFIAALVSAAMVETNRDKIIQTALKTIPADSAYAEAVRDAVAWHRQYPDWQSAWAQLDKKWGFLKNGKRDGAFADARYNTGKDPYLWRDIKWVYADVNGAAVTLALLYGDGNFTKSVCLAVMIGYDNDCNTGTVGAVLGAINGTQAIAESWQAPLRDTYQTTLNLPEKRLKISAIAAETAQHGQRVVKASAGRR
jgi:ADP-ribosylglycohydrolase